jgi:hypothetical protein
MAHLLRCVADNVPQRVDEHPPDFSTGHEDVDAILYTDATPEGYGGVLLIPGQPPTAIGGVWRTRPASINLAEAAAVWQILLAFRDRLQGRRVLVRVDNTSALAHLQGVSRAWRSAQELRYVADSVKALALDLRLEYVQSQDNEADGPSRFFKAPGIPHVRRGDVVRRRLGPPTLRTAPA